MESRKTSYRCLGKVALHGLVLVGLLLMVAIAYADTGMVPEDHAPWALFGEIVTQEGAKPGWLVFDRAGVSAVHCREEQIPKNARVIKYDGFIFPGLIDTRNHAHWNSISHWRAGRLFNNRYEWQNDPEYLQKVKCLYYDHLQKARAEYASLKYAQVRALIGGTTAIQSTYLTPEPELLIRKLDLTYGTDSRVPDIAQIGDQDLRRFRSEFAQGKIRRVFFHLAEGRSDDVQSAREFSVLEAHGLVRPGVVVIHGITLNRQEFQKMAKSGMYLVWSPKSNIVLYNETARVLDALHEGVTVALAPDWTITGSDNVLEEMKFAYDYSKKHLEGKVTPKDIFRMTTVDASKVAGVEERLGRLDYGYAADLFLAPKLDADPFQSLLKTRPRHIHLVFVDGVPLYGNPDEMKRWIAPSSLDSIRVENSDKAILMQGDPRSVWHSTQRFDDVVRILDDALPCPLAPLTEDAPAMSNP